MKRKNERKKNSGIQFKFFTTQLTIDIDRFRN